MPVMFSLSNFIWPDEGLICPAIILNKVVFPAPFGPINPVMDPFFISIDTLL